MDRLRVTFVRPTLQSLFIIFFLTSVILVMYAKNIGQVLLKQTQVAIQTICMTYTECKKTIHIMQGFCCQDDVEIEGLLTATANYLPLNGHN